VVQGIELGAQKGYHLGGEAIGLGHLTTPLGLSAAILSPR